MKFLSLLATLFVTTCLSVKGESIDTSRIIPLISRLNINVTQLDIDSLINYISSPSNSAFTDTAKTTVHNIFRKAANQKYILISLAKYRCPFFDIELATLSKNIIKSDGTLNRQLLDAIENSGGNLIYDILIRFCQYPLKDMTAVAFRSKRALWEYLFQKDMLNTFSSYMHYYAYNKNGKEELNHFPVNEMVINHLKELKDHESMFIEILPCLQYFLLSEDSRSIKDPQFFEFGLDTVKKYQFPSLFIGKRGDARFLINQNIFNVLKQHNSISSLAILADFLRCDDHVLREEAKKISFKKLANTQTLPLLFNATNDSIITKTVFKNQRHIAYDYSNIYLSISNYLATSRLLSFYDEDGFFNLDSSYSEVNYRKVPIVYQNVILNCMQDLKSRFKIDSLKFDTSIFYKTFTQFWKSLRYIKNYHINFFDFTLLYAALNNSLEMGIEKEGLTPETSDSIAQMVIGKEFDRKALMAYSLTKVKKYFTHGMPAIRFDNIDRIFDSLSISYSGSMFVKSKLSSSLLKDKVTSLHSPKVLRDVRVLERKYCFTDGMYLEKIQYKDEKNIINTINWYGTIPVNLLIPLLKNYHLFDFTNYSLSVSDWMNSSQAPDKYMQTLDFIRIDPVSACSYLFFSLNQQDLPDNELKELLILNSNRLPRNWEIENKILNSFPSAKPYYRDTLLAKRSFYPFLDFGGKYDAEKGFPGNIAEFAGNYVCRDSAEYNRLKKGYSQPFLQFLLLHINRRIDEYFLNYDINEVPENKPCKDGDVLCYAGIATNENHDRTWAINNTQDVLNHILRDEEYLHDWDITGYTLLPTTKIFMRQCLISADYKSFFATYELGDGRGRKYVNIEGEIPPLPEEFKIILKLYPGFLKDYNLDLAGALQNSSENFSTALFRYYNYRYGINSTCKLFNTAGYSSVKLWSIGLQPKGILFRSDEGRMICSEVTFINELFKYGESGDIENINIPSPDFIKAVNEQGSVAHKFVEDQAFQFANATLAALREHKKDFSISIGISNNTDDTNGSIFLQITAGSFSFKFSTSNDFSKMIIQAQDSHFYPLQATFNFEATDDKLMNDLQTGQKGIDVKTSVHPDLFPQDFPTIISTNSLPLSIDNQRGNLTIDINTGDESLVNNWMNMNPVIGPGPWANSDFNDHPENLQLLVTQAYSKFTQQELKSILKAIKEGYLPDPLVELIIKRRNQAIEDENISSGQWVRTKVLTTELIPPVAFRHEMTEDEYIKAFNSGDSENFNRLIKMKQTACNYKQVFEDGLPGLSLMYDKDFKYMMWTYQYKCLDGSLIEKHFLNKVFPSLTPLLVANPDGHVLEKLASLAVESFAGHPDENNPMRKTEYKKLDDAEHFERSLSKQLAEFAKTYKDSLQSVIKNYFDSFKQWQKENSKNSSIEYPYIPDPNVAPVLNLFVPPWEWHVRRMETVEKILTFQRKSSFFDAIKHDKIKIILN
ncbi:MAG TPA: hypothetical protein DIT07_12930 [Sphingobacteriaceae bacterium]|nr:hypothetical protein [Sphingobacteriaceae bacterium]